MTDLIKTRDVDPMDAAVLADWMDTVFYALSKLRSGELRLDGTRDEDTLSAIYTGINDLSVRLIPRLQGIVEALVRAHYDAGGTHGELARAMDVERSTAQTRGDKVRKTAPPSTWERWAAGELDPQTRPAAEVRPGWTLISHGHHLQVSRVVHHVDGGHVSITTTGGTISHTAPNRPVPVLHDVVRGGAGADRPDHHRQTGDTVMASVQEIRDAVSQYQGEARELAQLLAEIGEELDSVLGLVMELLSSDRGETTGLISQARSRVTDTAGSLAQLAEALTSYQQTLTVD